MLVRIAALVAADAPPASYLLNLGAASELDIGAEQVRGVLLAIAPIVGTVRIVSAIGNIARALGFAIESAELEAAAAKGHRSARRSQPCAARDTSARCTGSRQTLGWAGGRRVDSVRLHLVADSEANDGRAPDVETNA